MTQNLWKIINYDDLLTFLRSKNNKFIVLCLMLKHFDEEMMSNVRKNIVSMSNEYKDVMFLYYPLYENELSKYKISIISNYQHPNTYPRFLVIRNPTTIIFDKIVITDENEKYLKEHGEYEKEILPLNNMIQNIIEILNNRSSFDTISETQEYSENKNNQQNIDNKNQSHQSFNPTMNQMMNQMPNPMTNPAMNQHKVDHIQERKKLEEKIEVLREKYDEMYMEYLEDCKNRKKKEDKSIKKTQK